MVSETQNTLSKSKKQIEEEADQEAITAAQAEAAEEKQVRDAEEATSRNGSAPISTERIKLGSYSNLQISVWEIPSINKYKVQLQTGYKPKGKDWVNNKVSIPEWGLPQLITILENINNKIISERLREKHKAEEG